MKKITTLLIFSLLLLASITPALAETYTQTFTKEDRTYVTIKTIENGIIRIETKIYSASGELIKTEVTEKVQEPTPVKEKVYPTKTTTPKPIVTKTPERVSPTPKPEDETSKPSVSAFLQSDLPLDISSKSGNLIVKTESGDKELTRGPEEIMEKAEGEGMDRVAEVKLIEASHGLKYEVSGTKQEKLLGVIDVYLPTILTYNVDDGGLEKVEQSTLVKLTDLFSI